LEEEEEVGGEKKKSNEGKTKSIVDERERRCL
jgi:hypothetical protein